MCLRHILNQSASPTLYLFTILYYLLPTAEGSTGTPGGTRTPDLLLRRQLLYPAELLAHLNGAGDGNRTRVSSLEGWCSTIELHPHSSASRIQLVNSNIDFFSCQAPKWFFIMGWPFFSQINCNLAGGARGQWRTGLGEFAQHPDETVGEARSLPRGTNPQYRISLGEFVLCRTWYPSTEHAGPEQKREAKSLPYSQDGTWFHSTHRQITIYCPVAA